jgi:hypothetical protein
MISPRVHIVGRTSSKSYLEVIPFIISSSNSVIIEPQIHVEDELFSISLVSQGDMDSSPVLAQLQKQITNYLDWQQIEYIIHEDGVTSFFGQN